MHTILISLIVLSVLGLGYLLYRQTSRKFEFNLDIIFKRQRKQESKNLRINKILLLSIIIVCTVCLFYYYK